MKPTANLLPLLGRAGETGIFGTKMRSVIKLADQTGVRNAVNVLDGGVAIGYGTSDVRRRREARRDVGALNHRDVSGGWGAAPSRYGVAGQ